jgi:hypothetical protein
VSGLDDALAGLRVCRFHAGNTKQANAKAQERLDAMLERAVERVGELSEQGEHLPTALAASKQILDRTLGPTQTKSPAGTGIVVNVGVGLVEALQRNKPSAHPVIEASVVSSESASGEE